MKGPEGPGYGFIQQYEHGLPETRKELSRCVGAYVDFLLEESGQENLPPVDLDAIFDHFSLQAMEGNFKEASLGIEGANLAEMGMIVFDSSDIQTRQRFTQAHELLECLIVALEGNRYPSSLESYIEGKKKERLCNWGAARLLMPIDLFHQYVCEHGIGIEAAERIARAFKTSRLATLRHMVNCYPKQCGLIIWKREHRPTDTVRPVSKSGGTLGRSGGDRRPWKRGARPVARPGAKGQERNLRPRRQVDRFGLAHCPGPRGGRVQSR
jgi:hypothetical protein